MQSKTICFCLFLIFILGFLGSLLWAQSMENVCPINQGDDRLIEAPPVQRGEISSSKDYTVPRKQVLLEIATATW